MFPQTCARIFTAASFITVKTRNSLTVPQQVNGQVVVHLCDGAALSSNKEGSLTHAGAGEFQGQHRAEEARSIPDLNPPETVIAIMRCLEQKNVD